MKTFKNKVALITGAASGMGKYLAINLAKEGADVVICDVDESGLKETEKLIKAYNVGSSSLLLDVRDKKEVEELPTKIIENHGKIDPQSVLTALNLIKTLSIESTELLLLSTSPVSTSFVEAMAGLNIRSSNNFLHEIN